MFCLLSFGSGIQFREQTVIVEGMRKCTRVKESRIREILRQGMHFCFCVSDTELCSKAVREKWTESRGSGVRRKGFVREKRKDFKVKLAILCCVFRRLRDICTESLCLCCVHVILMFARMYVKIIFVCFYICFWRTFELLERGLTSPL